MQYTTQYSTVQYSTVQRSKVQYSTAQYSTVQYKQKRATVTWGDSSGVRKRSDMDYLYCTTCIILTILFTTILGQNQQEVFRLASSVKGGHIRARYKQAGGIGKHLLTYTKYIQRLILRTIIYRNHT